MFQPLRSNINNLHAYANLVKNTHLDKTNYHGVKFSSNKTNYKMIDLNKPFKKIKAFKGSALKNRLACLEELSEGLTKIGIKKLCSENNIDETLLGAVIALKVASSQIDELLHAIGVLMLVPKILERDELVERLSLGAGNTGKDFDLVTDKRIAEFKFMHWKGGTETIRKNKLFEDFFYLAEYNTKKKRQLYVIGLIYPLKFMEGGRRLSSILKEKRISNKFYELYGNRFSVVSEYYHYRKQRVKIIDLTPLIPSINELII
jgi:hypothetical protein